MKPVTPMPKFISAAWMSSYQGQKVGCARGDEGGEAYTADGGAVRCEGQTGASGVQRGGEGAECAAQSKAVRGVQRERRRRGGG